MNTLTLLKNSSLILSGLCLFLCLNVSAQPNYPRTPEDAKLIYTDLEHFMEAYDELATNRDTLQVLQTLYFDQVHGRREDHPEWLALI